MHFVKYNKSILYQTYCFHLFYLAPKCTKIALRLKILAATTARRATTLFVNILLLKKYKCSKCQELFNSDHSKAFLQKTAQYFSPLFLSTFCPSSVLLTITLTHGSSSQWISWNIQCALKCYICHSCSQRTSVMQQSLPLGFSRQAYSDRKPVFIIRLRQFLALKWGSGKQMNIFQRLYFAKYWQRWRIVFVLTTPIWLNLVGYLILYPRIFSATKLTNLSLIQSPSSNLSGNTGAKPNSRPPYPQPTSITVTFLLLRAQFLGDQQNEGCSTVLQQARWFCSMVPAKQRGQCAFQSTKVWWGGKGKGVVLRGLMWARMRQSFFLGMQAQVLTSLRLPSSFSDSSLCFLSRFIKEICNQLQLDYLVNGRWMLVMRLDVIYEVMSDFRPF